MNRKDFIKTTGLATGSFAVAPVNGLFANSTEPKVKVGLIGVGLRGQNHLDLLLRRNDVDVIAVCDIDDRMLKMSKEILK